jgi:hypothetical protein
MSWQDMIEGSSGLPTVRTFSAPSGIDARAETPFGLLPTDQVDAIDVGGQAKVASRQIVRKMKDAERLNFQMNPPTTKHNDAGAMLVNYDGGYFKGWYITEGVVNYLLTRFTTENQALEAAENARREWYDSRVAY